MSCYSILNINPLKAMPQLVSNQNAVEVDKIDTMLQCVKYIHVCHFEKQLLPSKSNKIWTTLNCLFWLCFPQIPLRVRTTTLLLDGFTILPHAGCLLWSSYQSSPMGLCWWPLQNSRNSVTLSTGSWSILLLLILERQFLLALSVYAISFLVTLFLDIQCASLRATLSQFVVSSHK